MLLIQIGGLGFMIFAILAALSLSTKLGLKQQIMAQKRPLVKPVYPKYPFHH